MAGAFGLLEGQTLPRIPPERIAENRPCLDAFALYRKGVLTGKGSVCLGPNAQVLELRSHVMLASPIFGCPRCGRDCYRLYLVADLWACRKCHKLDYASRHRNRSIPGYIRILYLRRRVKAEPRPFAPIASRPRSHVKYHKLVAEIRALEHALLAHLRTEVNDVIERRIARRKE
jgi:hypothetical protein